MMGVTFTVGIVLIDILDNKKTNSLILSVAIILGLVLNQNIIVNMLTTEYSGKTYTCDWDSKTYKGKGYTSVMRIVRQVDDENSPFNNYCSRSCANAFLRSTR